MNREERRRQAHKARREARRNPTPVILAGDGMVAAELPGHTFEAKPSASLPPKVPGRHRWIAMVTYVIPEAFAADDLMDERVPKFLDSAHVHYLALGCWDCEGLLQEVKDQPCPAHDEAEG